MKAEKWVFLITFIFFVLVTPLYWFVTEYNMGRGEPTGTWALLMTTGLVGMITAYLAYHSSHMDPRPEDRKEAEIPDGAGELGFFPPYSWWPLWCALTLSVMVFGVAAHAWWLFIIGAGLGVIALCGWVFEYYRGVHAH